MQRSLAPSGNATLCIRQIYFALRFVLIDYGRGRQPLERSVPFFDSVKIETSARAKRLPYFPLKISV